MKTIMIPISKPTIRKAEAEAVHSVLQSGHLVEGDVTHQLEHSFAELTGAKFAIAVNNGTAALHCALYALGVGPGDEVITTPFTFIATANAILMVGATPVFADIKRDTYTISPTEIEKKITKRSKAIIAVDLYGQPADYREILAIAKRHRLSVIDDAAQSVGAVYTNKNIGSIADVTCFSLYATKNITSGEGGMVTTDNPAVAEKIRIFKNQGQRPGVRYDYIGFGFNYRMTDIAAAIAFEQLKSIRSIINKRNATATLYDRAFRDILGIDIPARGKDRTHVFHQYTLRFTRRFPHTRDEVKEKLRAKGIQAEVYYPVPLYKYPHLVKDTFNETEFPETGSAVREVLSLPVYPQLQYSDIRYIIESIKTL